jgi:hypothetical protein
VFASGPAVPDYLMMDLRGMRIGDKVMASQVELNEGLRLVSTRPGHACKMQCRGLETRAYTCQSGAGHTIS